MKLDRIEVQHLDFGVGVLRGAVALIKPLRDKPEQVELAIEHIQAAARAIERVQRQLWNERAAQKRRPRRRGKRRMECR